MRPLLINWAPTPIGAGWEIDPDPVVWVSVSAIERSFLVGDQFVGPGGSGCGQASRYENIGQHFASGLPMFMPDISLREGRQIAFTDGRHRFAWVRDHGAEALPVTIGGTQAAKLSHLFGTELRECKVLLGP